MMAETLLAILLVTSSAKGSSLVYRWPPHPKPSARLARPRPDQTAGASQLDNPGRAASYSDMPVSAAYMEPLHNSQDDDDYEWQIPDSIRNRSMSFSRGPARPSSGRISPTDGVSFDLESVEDPAPKDDYDNIFGYSSEFLAGLLCPQRSLCHQKFELIVDDLAFIGHPVCAEENGSWCFKPEKYKNRSRGRGSRNGQLSQLDETDPDHSSVGDHPTQSPKSWLQKFHLVIVLDLPDPSSSESGNISKYFDIIYEQIAFTVTAVLFQEQVISNFVEAECESLGSLKDEYISQGQLYSWLHSCF